MGACGTVSPLPDDTVLADTVGEREIITMVDVLCRPAHGKYSERPPRCADCAGPAWWNGKRRVAECRKRGDLEYVPDLVRRRACCPSPDCPRGSWTVYEEDSYPHRVFALDLVVSAVAAVVLGRATLTAAANAHWCSRDTVRRWVGWVSRLAEPTELMRVCTRLEPRGLPGGLALSDMPRGAAVLHLLDRLADLLADRGVQLRPLWSGLARILADQLERLGAVFFLTKPSPPLRADLGGVAL